MGMSLSGTLTNPRYPMESEIHMGNDLVLGGQGDGFVMVCFRDPNSQGNSFMWSKGVNHWLSLDALKIFKKR